MKFAALLLGSALLLISVLPLGAAGTYSNRRAPGFSLSDIKMVQHDPQDYRGKVLFIDVMTTTCPNCQKLADTLVQLTGKMGTKAAVLSIVTFPDTQDKVRSFIDEHKVPWPVLFDCGQVIASYLKVTPANPSVHFPHLFVVDPAGMIRADYEGTDEKFLSMESLSAEIAKYNK